MRDEVWQGMISNDFTSDEVSRCTMGILSFFCKQLTRHLAQKLYDGDVFTMRDDAGPCNLKGPLHP